MADSTVDYFKGLASDTEPLRAAASKKTASPAPVRAAPKAAETKGVLKYDDDDLKYMSKQAYKIGERLSKSAAKRSPVKQSPKR